MSEYVLLTRKQGIVLSEMRPHSNHGVSGDFAPFRYLHADHKRGPN